jgi:phenylalanine-4-hydroxylase
MTTQLTQDLTTTRAPFIEEARGRGDLFIHQPYELYSETNQETWRRLYAGMLPRWRRHANPRFLEGLERLSLDQERIPRLEDINRFLRPLTGFQARAVSGYVPSYLFFDCLRRREFPTTITIRPAESLDYLPEPDIFHDVAGHVPMHTDSVFAGILVKIGEVARAAAVTARRIAEPGERMRRLESTLKAMSRFFWFTVEFGLMRRGGARQRPGGPPSGSPGAVCVYGSGLLSSRDEIEHAVESPDVVRLPFSMERAVNQTFEIDHFQPLLFVIGSFEDLYAEVEKLERWVLEGKLGDVSPGEPEIDETDLQSFLDEARE